MNGYYNMDASSEFDKNGFFKTGDLLYYDENFNFYIVDRLKEMFKYRGWHVVPAKIEAILNQHPDVYNSIVVGIPHPSDGFHPQAIVKKHQDAKVTDDEIVEFVASQVGEMDRLRAGVVFVDDFVYTATGKINRRKTYEAVAKISKKC